MYTATVAHASATGDSLWAPGHVSRILVCGMVRGSRVVPMSVPIVCLLGGCSKMNFHLLHYTCAPA